jgi:7-cyano-7-deazaguanine tRNA-ribosyltransferase
LEAPAEPVPCKEGDHGKFEVSVRDGLARIGRLHTDTHILETPTLLPVVNPNILTVTPREMWDDFGIKGLITNSYVIWKHEKLKQHALEKGVHDLLDYPGFVMTDSGTFQQDAYGDVEVGPDEIVAFQRDIGVDVATMLDVFGRPDDSRERSEHSVIETVARAPGALAAAGDTLLNGPIQGGLELDLREWSAQLMGEHPFAIHPIGGIVPLMEKRRYRELLEVILACRGEIPIERPVHLFGCGHPMLFPVAVALGVDLFDSAAYALFARNGRILTPTRTVRLDGLTEWPFPSYHLRDVTPAQVREMDPNDQTRLLAKHNLEVTMNELSRCREAVREGTIWHLVEERAAADPSLQEAVEWLFDEGIHQAQGSLIGSSAPIRTGGVDWTEWLTRHPWAISAQMIAERWEVPTKNLNGEDMSPDDWKVVLIHGRPPPWRDSIGSLVKEVLKRWPNVLPLVHTPLGIIPYALEDLNPFAHVEGPKSIWMLDVEQDTDELVSWLKTLTESDSEGFHPLFADARRPQTEVLEELAAELAPSVLVADASIDSESSSGELIRDHLDWCATRAKLMTLCNIEAQVADDVLDGCSFVRNRRGRVKNICASDGEHILSSRLSDGGLSLTLEGARRLHARNRTSSITLRVFGESEDGAEENTEVVIEHGLPTVVVEEGAEEFVRKGRSVMHFSVVKSTGVMLPGLPCVITDESGEFLAHGIAKCTDWEAAAFQKGVAVKVKEGARIDASAAFTTASQSGDD